MSALAFPPQGWTVEAYLDMERASEVRHEYLDGLVYALAGGTGAHSRLGANAIAAFHTALRDGPCGVYSSDLKVRVGETRLVYPDASVGCAGVERNERGDEWLTEPALVVEVLLMSTAAYDRGGKFDLYRRLPSLRGYVLVETTTRLVEARSRLAGGAWATRAYGPGEAFELPGLGGRIAVDELYEKVELDAPDEDA
jgi:Uma2 family endonuclease